MGQLKASTGIAQPKHMVSWYLARPEKGFTWTSTMEYVSPALLGEETLL